MDFFLSSFSFLLLLLGTLDVSEEKGFVVRTKLVDVSEESTY